MVRPLWQLLLENPSHLTCDECFAVLEYYADMLVASDGAVLAEVLKRLESCPECSPEHRKAISRLSTIGKQAEALSSCDTSAPAPGRTSPPGAWIPETLSFHKKEQEYQNERAAD
jgi:hypothetical protein